MRRRPRAPKRRSTRVYTARAVSTPTSPRRPTPAATAARGGACPRVLPLRWGRAETEAFLRGERGGFDIVVGTDLMYVNEAVVALVETLDVRAAPPPAASTLRRRSDAARQNRSSAPSAACRAQVLSSPGPGEEGSRRRPAEVLLAYGRNRWAEGAFMEAAKEVFSIEDVPASELDEACADAPLPKLHRLYFSPEAFCIGTPRPPPTRISRRVCPPQNRAALPVPGRDGSAPHEAAAAARQGVKPAEDGRKLPQRRRIPRLPPPPPAAAAAWHAGTSYAASISQPRPCRGRPSE